MRTNKSKFITLVATAVIASVFTGCTKDDVENQTYSYIVKLSLALPYDEDRSMAPDSLIEFITVNMGLERDTVPNSWLVTGESENACDKLVLDLFEKACDMVDPELYGGEYYVSVFRETADDIITISEREFIATDDNGKGTRNREGVYLYFNKDDTRNYVYDLAIAAGGSSSETEGKLNNLIDSFPCTALLGDLNQDACGTYIYIGAFVGNASFNTFMLDSIYNNQTSDMEWRQYTAKELAITSIVCLQHDGTPPNSFDIVDNNNIKTTYFQFRKAPGTNGNTNQNTKHGHKYYLYYARSKYGTPIKSLYYKSKSHKWAWDKPIKDDPNLIKMAKWDDNARRYYISSDYADLNGGNRTTEFTHIGYTNYDY